MKESASIVNYFHGKILLLPTTKDNRTPLQFIDNFERKLGNATREQEQKARVFLGLITKDTNLQWTRSPQIVLNYEHIKTNFLKHFWTTEVKKKVLEEFKKCSRFRGGFTNFKDFLNHWEDRCKGIVRDEEIALDIYLTTCQKIYVTRSMSEV